MKDAAGSRPDGGSPPAAAPGDEDEDPRPRASSSAAPSTTTAACRHWARAGACLYGDRCKFAHASPNTVGGAPASPPPPPDGRSRAYERNRRVRKRGKCGHLRRFLLERFGADALRSGPVLDVGGGKGELAFELENLNDVRTVVVDAAPLRLAKLEKKLRGGWFHRGTWAEPRPVAEETEKNRLPRGSPGDEDAKPTREPPERSIRRPAHWRVLWSPELWREVRLPDDARRRPAEGEGEDASSAATSAAAASADAAARAALHRHWAAAATVRFRAAGEHAEDGRTRGGVSAALRSLSKPGGGAAASGDIFERRERREGDDSDSRSGSDSGSDSSAATTARARCECGDAPECGAYPPDLGLVRDALERCSAVVGMHSDHATEWIVDFALERRKRFAVVPCCVCPESFPTRRGPGGGGAVRTHDAFVEYLVAKGAEGEIATGTLGFDGKNVVVYSTYDVVDDVEEGSG